MMGCDKEKSTQVIIIIPTLRSQWLFHMGRKTNYYKLQGRKVKRKKIKISIIKSFGGQDKTFSCQHLDLNLS